MQLADYLHGLQRLWWTVAASALIGIVAAAGFLRLTLLDQASASVAVLDPLSSRATGYVEAQVTFDSIIKSEALAEKVATILNEDPGTVRSNLSVTAATTLNTNNPSPLYVVHGRDRGVDRAILLVNTAIDQARKLYTTLNAADASSYRASIENELKVANDDLAAAQKALDAFGAANNAVNLTARLASATNAAAGGDAAAAAERDRLDKLAGQYNTLEFAVEVQQSRVKQVATTEETLQLGEALPTGSEVKLLDEASEEGQGLYRTLVYALGLVLGVAVGLAAIYAVVLTRRRPATPQEVAAAFGAQVLVRIPRSAS